MKKKINLFYILNSCGQQGVNPWASRMVSVPPRYFSDKKTAILGGLDMAKSEEIDFFWITNTKADYYDTACPAIKFYMMGELINKKDALEYLDENYIKERLKSKHDSFAVSESGVIINLSKNLIVFDINKQQIWPKARQKTK